jgi:hypothetical protein
MLRMGGDGSSQACISLTPYASLTISDTSGEFSGEFSGEIGECRECIAG